MPVTLYEAVIPGYIKNLKTLAKLLEKGVAHAKSGSNGLTEEKLIGSRLIADMHPLTFQIQSVSDTAKGVATRLGKVAPVVLEDNEKTFPELFERIQKTIKILESVKKEDLNANEDITVTIGRGAGERKLSAKDYIFDYAIPNFYFHFVTAYNILRKEGVEVGKKNYLGTA